MTVSKQCPKCAGSMSDGFTLDWTHGGVKVSSWAAGVPEKNMWTGIKLTGFEQRSISTWRCGRCGFLEQYAVGDPAEGRAQEKQQRVLLSVIVLLTTMVLAVVVGIKLA